MQADDQVYTPYMYDVGSWVASERNILENTTAADTKIPRHAMSSDGAMHYRYLVVISFEINPQKTPHSSSVKARYKISLVGSYSN